MRGFIHHTLANLSGVHFKGKKIEIGHINMVVGYSETRVKTVNSGSAQCLFNT